MACIPDKVAYHVVITSWQECAAVGIDWRAKSQRGRVEAKFKGCDLQLRGFIGSAGESQRLGLHTVVWRIAGSTFKAFYSSGMDEAKEMYHYLDGSPCAAALFDKGELFMHYGRYRAKWKKRRRIGESK